MTTRLSTRVPARTLANPIARRPYSSTRSVQFSPYKRVPKGTMCSPVTRRQEARRAYGAFSTIPYFLPRTAWFYPKILVLHNSSGRPGTGQNTRLWHCAAMVFFSTTGSGCGDSLLAGGCGHICTRVRVCTASTLRGLCVLAIVMIVLLTDHGSIIRVLAPLLPGSPCLTDKTVLVCC